MKYLRFLICFCFVAMFSLPLNAFAKRPINHYEELVQPMYVPLTADLGTVMVKFEKKDDLANSRGNADIFKRKVDMGKKELLYEGIDAKGFIKLKISDVDVSTNVNAFNIMQPSYKFYDYGNGGISGVTYKTRKPYYKINKPNVATLNYDYKSNNNMIEFGGKKVKILEVTPINIKYYIINQNDL